MSSKKIKSITELGYDELCDFFNRNELSYNEFNKQISLSVLDSLNQMSKNYDFECNFLSKNLSSEWVEILGESRIEQCYKHSVQIVFDILQYIDIITQCEISYDNLYILGSFKFLMYECGNFIYRFLKAKEEMDSLELMYRLIKAADSSINGYFVINQSYIDKVVMWNYLCKSDILLEYNQFDGSEREGAYIVYNNILNYTTWDNLYPEITNEIKSSFINLKN